MDSDQVMASSEYCFQVFLKVLRVQMGGYNLQTASCALVLVSNSFTYEVSRDKEKAFAAFRHRTISGWRGARRHTRRPTEYEVLVEYSGIHIKTSRMRA